MQLVSRQRGATLITMLVLAMMVGTLVTMGLRVTPAYLEYRTVRSVLKSVASEAALNEAPMRETTRRIEALFNTNQIYALKPSEVKVTRESGKFTIDGRYETRTHLFANIDAVIKFEDLVFVVGE